MVSDLERGCSRYIYTILHTTPPHVNGVKPSKFKIELLRSDPEHSILVDCGVGEV
jgi:hypothetical protein